MNTTQQYDAPRVPHHYFHSTGDGIQIIQLNGVSHKIINIFDN